MVEVRVLLARVERGTVERREHIRLGRHNVPGAERNAQGRE
jgi:hypothetical protein